MKNISVTINPGPILSGVGPDPSAQHIGISGHDLSPRESLGPKRPQARVSPSKTAENQGYRALICLKSSLIAAIDTTYRPVFADKKPRKYLK
jgi:hypothetical protein